NATTHEILLKVILERLLQRFPDLKVPENEDEEVKEFIQEAIKLCPLIIDPLLTQEFKMNPQLPLNKNTLLRIVAFIEKNKSDPVKIEQFKVALQTHSTIDEISTAF